MGQGQEITVGYLVGSEQAGWVEFLAVEDADIVGPEVMAGLSEEFGEQLRNGRRVAWRIRIALVAENAQDGVFGERAAGPSLTAGAREPSVRVVVMNMSWIEKSDQDVYVQQECGHGKSSRS